MVTMRKGEGMPIIKKEYPEGLRFNEMTLVKMLLDHRSWSDYRDIAQAIWNVRFHAQQMQKEQQLIQGTGCSVGNSPDRNDTEGGGE